MISLGSEFVTASFEIKLDRHLIRANISYKERDMAYKAIKTEHSGAKNSSAKGGYWGYRSDAKRDSKKLRRRNGKNEIRKALGGALLGIK